MSKTFLRIYVPFAMLVIGWMVWSDYHEPNCLQLYGEPRGTVDQFLSCSSANMSHDMDVQFIALCAIGAFVVISVAATLMLENWFGYPDD